MPMHSASLSYSISGGADASAFAINSTTGALSFVSAPNFENPSDTGLDGTYDVVVQVSDGTNVDSQAIAVTVTDQNEAPTITSGNGNTATLPGERKHLRGRDHRGRRPGSTSSPTFSISGGADAALFQIDANTGELSFISAPNFESPADIGGDNNYEVVVNVSDGSLPDTQAITVAVQDVNEAPTQHRPVERRRRREQRQRHRGGIVVRHRRRRRRDLHLHLARRFQWPLCHRRQRTRGEWYRSTTRASPTTRSTSRCRSRTPPATSTARASPSPSTTRQSWPHRTAISPGRRCSPTRTATSSSMSARSPRHPTSSATSPSSPAPATSSSPAGPTSPRVWRSPA